MKLAYIPASTFIMGSPASEAGRDDDETQHKVTLTKAFLMGTTHVTRGQFAAFVKDTGYKTDAQKDAWALVCNGATFAKVDGASWLKPGFDQGDDHPVVEVSWNDATAFCVWISKKEGKHYRLPTEAEWEYTCRAGTQTAYPWGDNPDDGKGWANCADQTLKQKFPKFPFVAFNWTDGFVFTSPVGTFKPNAFGLYDMIGNADEWCADWYGKYLPGDATDPQGPSAEAAPRINIPLLNYNGPARVLRGGSWVSNPLSCRSGNRDNSSLGSRVNLFGFRAALDFD
jgi:formylglycine-generating enzyme required for sulfatase activity